ncbi:MAG: ribonuclease III [Ferrimicrobium sp.]
MARRRRSQPADVPHPLDAVVPEAIRSAALYKQALRHKSATMDHQLDSNERLEFLGDAVLELIVSELVYHRFSEVDEGRLTKMRSAVVSRRALGQIARRLLVVELLEVGQEDARTVVSGANALEAIIGATYLEGGLDVARQVVETMTAPLVEELAQDLVLGDYKSLLHETLAKLHYGPPRYVVTWEGPDHSRSYSVEVTVPGSVKTVGHGRSRKEADQDACAQAIEEINRRAAELEGEDAGAS